MARKIIWTLIAQQERKDILSYWKNRNKSTVYPRKLNLLFIETINFLSENPQTGSRTDFENILCKRVRDYKIFYKTTDDKFFVLSVWDMRKNPDELEGKL